MDKSKQVEFLTLVTIKVCLNFFFNKLPEKFTSLAHLYKKSTIGNAVKFNLIYIALSISRHKLKTVILFLSFLSIFR